MYHLPTVDEFEARNVRARWYVFCMIVITTIIGCILVSTNHWYSGIGVLAVSGYFVWMLGIMPPAESTKDFRTELSPELDDRFYT